MIMLRSVSSGTFMCLFGPSDCQYCRRWGPQVLGPKELKSGEDGSAGKGAAVSIVSLKTRVQFPRKQDVVGIPAMPAPLW